MRQYHSVKSEFPNALLLFRLGDFYELFYEDAVVASRDLEITLTSRNKEKGEPVPMCGVPFHAADNYIAKLIAKGHRVAVCDQVEDAKKAKKLVRREVTRVVTPGTASDTSLLKSGENNYLAAVAEKGETSGMAYVDVSTGEFRMTELEPSEEDIGKDISDSHRFHLNYAQIRRSHRRWSCGGSGSGVNSIMSQVVFSAVSLPV